MAWFRWVANDEVVVSRIAVEDVVENGVVRRTNQQLLSEETGIKIKKLVGGRKPGAKNKSKSKN